MDKDREVSLCKGQVGKEWTENEEVTLCRGIGVVNGQRVERLLYVKDSLGSEWTESGEVTLCQEQPFVANGQNLSISYKSI